jgi:DNA gyrase subunit A
MPIYRMTKEEVQKRKLLVTEESELLKKYKKIAGSSRLVNKALVTELDDVSDKLDDWLRKRERETKALKKVLDKKVRSKKKR